VQLEHSFTVPVGIDDAWRVLLDIELIAPCMPGAAIESVDGDDFTGNVKVKLGPIGLTYKGRASFIEKNETAHRAVIDARGRDSRGSGTANAKVTATLTESGGSTRVDVLTDLDITGKPAQFGRGVMADVGNKLIGQFAECLAGKLTEGATPDAPATSPSKSPASPTETAVSDETPTTPKSRPRPRKAAADSAPAAADADQAAPAMAPTESSAAESAPAKAAPAPAPAAESSPAASSAATATASTSASVPAPDAPATTEPTTGDAMAEEKVSAMTPLPTRTATAPRRPADDVEPINLIQSAGPPLAKRLAPIVALVVLLILIARRRRH
jgi:carbon monoxide dehydrogenase subunit G